MRTSGNPRSPSASARKVMFGRGIRLIGLLVLSLLAPVAAQAASTPDGLTAGDWQAIRAQVPAAPQSLPAGSEVAQQAYLKAHNAGTNHGFGVSVAVSGDTVVVGAYSARETEESKDKTGAAYVFVRGAGGEWSQQGYLKAHNGASQDYFGYSVAISGDTVVVGAPFESTGGGSAGAAYVFQRGAGGDWSQQAYLKAHNADAFDYFGATVAISGNTVLVGARGESGPAGGDGSSNDASSSGAAYVFVRSGTSWSQQAYLKAEHAEAGDQFGNSVAISDDTMVIGAPYEDTGGGDSGAAHVFVHDGTSWTEQARLVADDAQASDTFGWSVAVSGDTVVVGAPFKEVGADAAYVFERSGVSWSQPAHLEAHNAGTDDYFGISVAISGDTVVVGAYGEDGPAGGDGSGNGAPNAGAAYVFERGGASWSQRDYLKAHNAEANDKFGYAVAVFGDTVMVGAYGEDGPAGGDGSGNSFYGAGATYVYVPGYVVQADVSGLTGTGLVLQNNGGDDLAIATDGLHAFATPLVDGSDYAVSVATQPTADPPQICTATHGSGTIAGADVTVDVTCATVTYTVTAIANGNGAITPTSVDVAHGDDAVFTITPAEGWHLDVVVGNTCTPIEQGDGTWIAGPITEACHVQAWFSIGLHTVGGSVSGLNGSGLVLRLNGGHDLAISSDGPFTFATTVASGQSYVATIASQPDGQACALANGSGTVGDADITDLAVTCASVSATPVLTIEDGREHARYGRSVDYLVTLANTGDAPIEASDVTFVPSTGFDAAFATLTCFAGTGSCTVDSNDPLHYTATVPVGGEVTWLVSIPVHGTTTEPSVELVVTATGATPAVDTNTLVILRDGFDVPYGDGTQGVETIDGERAKAILEGDDVARITVPDAEDSAALGESAADANGSSVEAQSASKDALANDAADNSALASDAAPRTLLRIRAETREVAIEHRWLRDLSLVRLTERSIGNDGRMGGSERASQWREAAPGSELTLGSIALDEGQRAVLLDGAATPLAID